MSAVIEERVAADRPDNLYEPVPGDFGAHGRFDQRARADSWQFWLTSHPGPVLGASAAAVLIGAVALAARQRQPDRARRVTARARRRLGPA